LFLDDGDFSMDELYKYIPVLEKNQDAKSMLILLEFDRPVLATSNAWAIGARLDLDIHTSTCRIAFYGQILHSFSSKNYRLDSLPLLKV